MRKREITIFLFIIMCLSGCQSKTKVETTVIENDVSKTEITSEAATEVIDTTPPEIIVSDKVAYCEVGKKIDFNEYFEVFDDKDENEELKIEVDDSKVDYEKPGKYSINYSATDSSDNKISASKDVYIYKDYTYEEMVEICNKLVEEKYYDFILTDDFVEYPEENKYCFEFIDGTDINDSPTGDSHIIGYIDWVLCCASMNVSVSRDQSHKNNNVSWNSELSISVLEYTNWGTLEDIAKVEIVSKSGKIILSIPEDVLGKWNHSYDEPDYKIKNAGVCFRSEEDVEKFIEIIDGVNPTIIFISDSGNEITRLKLDENDKINFQSAIGLYKDLNQYICNIPNDSIATSTDASPTDVTDN